MFIIIAAIQIKEKYYDIYLTEHSAQRPLVAYMQIIIRCTMTAAVRGHLYWMQILMTLVSKQTTEII